MIDGKHPLCRGPVALEAPPPCVDQIEQHEKRTASEHDCQAYSYGDPASHKGK